MPRLPGLVHSIGLLAWRCAHLRCRQARKHAELCLAELVDQVRAGAGWFRHGTAAAALIHADGRQVAWRIAAVELLNLAAVRLLTVQWRYQVSRQTCPSR